MPPHRERGIGDVVEIAEPAVMRSASVQEAVGKRPQAGAVLSEASGFAALTSVAASQWRALAEYAVEPNGYYLPDWELAVNASARGRTGVSALSAWGKTAPDNTAHLTGLVPVISMWRAYKIPLPALVSADPYGTLCTPLLDRDAAGEAAAGLIMQARRAGAHALILRDVSLDGAAIKAFTEVLRQGGMHPLVLQSHVRACLDATATPRVLREALGPKKLKELRRQRNRLAEHGAISFDVARTADDVAPAVETFCNSKPAAGRPSAAPR